MPSQKSSTDTANRSPKQQRGRERVAILTEAAAKVFVEKGFEAATMTEIAAEAKSSIGSLYQFFPTKALLAEALHVERLRELNTILVNLQHDVAGKRAAEIGEEIFARLGKFLGEFPEFPVLAARRDIPKERKAKSRAELRANIAALLRTAVPSIEQDVDLLAALVLELLRIIVTAAYDPDIAGDPRMVTELRGMLRKRLDEATP
jgi:AcrR family transcriptional regulator